MTRKAAIYKAIRHLDKIIELHRANRDALPGEAVRLVTSARIKLRRKLRAKVERSKREGSHKGKEGHA